MTATNRNELLEAALDYARRGWRVVPLHGVLPGGVCSCGDGACDSQGKHPRTKHGLTDGTTDEGRIRDWWGQWPRANVGVVCGPDSGVWMVGPDGSQGIDDLSELAKANGDGLGDLFQLAAVAKSQSGGRHLVFAWPADGQPIPNRKNHRGTKVDVRACGGGPGYFVAPPSVGPKGAYAWVGPPDECVGGTPAEAPAWLVAWARQAEPKPEGQADAPEVRAPAPPRPGAPTGSQHGRIVAYLAKCPASVSGQRGHDDLFRVARALVVGFALSDGDALAYLHNEFNPRCQPAWSQKELEHKVREARNKPFGKPVGYLRDAPNPLAYHPPERETVTPGEATAAGGNGTADGWPEPLPLRVIPPAPAFPLGVFPDYLAEFAESVAELTNVPVGYVTANVLGVAAGAIGATLTVELTEEWTERACLFVAVSAPKSSGKTPAGMAALKPLRRIQAEQAETDEKAVLFATDTTVEAIAPILRDRPRGLLVAADELSGFLGGMNQYKPGGKGGDRAFWLSCWAGTPMSVLRRNPESPRLWVPHPCVSVLGGVQPAILADAFGSDDGLAERFLFECSDPLPAGRATRGKYRRADAWHMTVEVLANRTMDSGRYGVRPHRVALTPDAWRVFSDWTAESCGPPDRDPSLDGFRSKARGYAGRLAVVLHAIRHATGEAGTALPDVAADTMASAVSLCRYYLAQVERLRAGAGGGQTDAERVLAWLAKCGRQGVTRRDIHRGLQRQFPKAELLAEPLRRLVQHGWLRYVATPPSTGRQPEAVYEIRPDLCHHLSAPVSAGGDTSTAYRTTG